MMDMSSLIDVSLTVGGAIAVVLIGISTLSSESTTVSTSFEELDVDAMTRAIRLLRPQPRCARHSRKMASAEAPMGTWNAKAAESFGDDLWPHVVAVRRRRDIPPMSL